VILILSIFCFLFFVLFIIAGFFAIKFGMTILKIEEATESALDILDTSYREIGKILQTPLFADSREIRSVLVQVRNSYNAILKVASIMTITFQEEQEEETETN